ncbi:MAG TPA: cell division protein ZapE [Alphaproteobacteria bacterium]|nr:cell division protein ZapE [Alphaproteobacteria bacterium]
MLPARTYAPLKNAFESRLSAGELRPDAAQQEALGVLEEFAASIDGYRPPSNSLVSRLIKAIAHKPPPSHGLYLYGDVGRGKSMLMDMFFSVVRVAKKRRVHFHQFMLEIQARLHRLQAQNVDDVLPSVAREIAAETWLLCFDEFHVSNIADAMILGRLFEALFEAGVVIVATSNWPPDALYKNGLQRERFLPFIELIKQRMTIYKLDGATDHRYEQIRGTQSYFSPLGEAATHQLQGVFLQLTDEVKPEPIELPVQGRTLKIVHAAKGVGFFNYEELCQQPLGSADFLAIAECLHTVLLDGVPKFTAEQRNETLRFINLIDALYEAKVKFFMAAAAPPEKLAPTGEHAFAFQRTVSRLMEMQGEEYRRSQHLAS